MHKQKKIPCQAYWQGVHYRLFICERFSRLLLAT